MTGINILCFTEIIIFLSHVWARVMICGTNKIILTSPVKFDLELLVLRFTRATTEV